MQFVCKHMGDSQARQYGYRGDALADWSMLSCMFANDNVNNKTYVHDSITWYDSMTYLITLCCHDTT